MIEQRLHRFDGCHALHDHQTCHTVVSQYGFSGRRENVSLRPERILDAMTKRDGLMFRRFPDSVDVHADMEPSAGTARLMLNVACEESPDVVSVRNGHDQGLTFQLRRHQNTDSVPPQIAGHGLDRRIETSVVRMEIGGERHQPDAERYMPGVVLTATFLNTFVERQRLHIALGNQPGHRQSSLLARGLAGEHAAK